ncbi:MAG: phosphoglycerate dehydrogenase [Ilumatobacteraceae bacterium]
MKRKVIITTSSFDLSNFHQLDDLTAAGIEVIQNPLNRRLNEQEVAHLLSDHVVAMIAGLEPLTAAVLTNAPNLKVIVRCGIGLDSVDLDAARAQGISVFNTPDAPTTAVAELTLAHILGLLRHVTESDREIRSGRWNGLMGSLLKNKVVGVVGYGRIGQAVAKLVSAFEASVVAFDSQTISLPNTKQLELADLCAQSDIITIHVPYSQDTHHLIDGDVLEQMKSTALLINVSRGGIIDEDALLLSLHNGGIAGAALDCFEIEPYSGPLLEIKNVQVTAHMGSYARESRDQMEIDASAALVRSLREQGIL